MKKSPFAHSFPIKEIQIEHYTVFYEQSIESLLSYFSKEEALKFAQLLQNAQIDPKNSHEQILEWKTKYPDNPLIDNLLTFLYLQKKEVKKAEKLIQESYSKYPDYLFAKINYADQCLRLKKPKVIPLIFRSFDLSELFPERSKFHVSEFRGFMTLVSRYYLLIKENENAKKFYRYAYEADPSHPSLISLEKQLFQKNLNLFGQCLNLCHVLIGKLRAKKRLSA